MPLARFTRRSVVRGSALSALAVSGIGRMPLPALAQDATPAAATGSRCDHAHARGGAGHCPGRLHLRLPDRRELQDALRLRHCRGQSQLQGAVQPDQRTPGSPRRRTPRSSPPTATRRIRSWWMDLRAEPIVLTFRRSRRTATLGRRLVQYTYNFGYVGSRATGNGAGCLCGRRPGLDRRRPGRDRQGLPVRTEFALACSGRSSSTRRHRQREGHPGRSTRSSRSRPSSASRAPAAAPAIDVAEDRQGEGRRHDPFGYLPSCSSSRRRPVRPRSRNRCARASPASASSRASRSRRRGSPPTPRRRSAAPRPGIAKVETLVKNWGEEVDGWRIAKDGFGDRAIARRRLCPPRCRRRERIFGNDAAEALYPLTRVDGEGQPLDGSKSQLHAHLPRRPVAAGQRLLVGDDVRRQDAAPRRQPDRPLPHQLADAARADQGCRRRGDALHPEGPAERQTGGELAAGAGRADLPCCACTGRRKRCSTASGRRRGCSRRVDVPYTGERRCANERPG